MPRDEDDNNSDSEDTDQESDSEDNEPKSKAKKSDFVKLGNQLIGSINFKLAFFIFFFGLLIFSDVFIQWMSFIDDAVYGNTTTTKGTVIQLIVLVLCFIVMDLLIKGDIV